MRKFVWLVMFMFLLVGTAKAELIVNDLNSTLKVDETSDFGMYYWTVDGVDHMYRQWFWYRIEGDTKETAINDLPLLQAVADDTIWNSIKLVYGYDDGLKIEITYTLSGGALGSNQSDVAETISIYNNSTSSINLSFFQYVDFNLGGDLDNDDDRAQYTNANTMTQWDDKTVLGEVVVTPSASHWQISTSPSLYNSLTDNSITTLSDSTSPYGPANIEWAWEWDFTIAAGSSFQISKDKQIRPVPEPATMLLVGAGLVGIGFFGRMKIRKK